MKPEFAEKYYRLEAAHPWSVGRRDIILRMLRSAGVHRSDRILEVGCGSGALVEAMEAAGYRDVTGLDMAEAAVGAARSRGLNNIVQADAAATDFDDGAFDCIIASDVLEHIMDESKALTEWRRLLRPGGLLFCFVPAFAFLWSEHDVENRHYRRYSRSMLESCVVEAGYKVERIGYWNGWLFLPMTGMRMIRRVVARQRGLERKDDFVPLNPLVSRVFNGLVQVENTYLGAGGELPIGVSVFAVLRTPE